MSASTTETLDPTAPQVIQPPPQRSKSKRSSSSSRGIRRLREQTERLRAYIEDLRVQSEPLPGSSNGKVNCREIARITKLSPNSLYANASLREMLEEASKSLGIRPWAQTRAIRKMQNQPGTKQTVASSDCRITYHVLLESSDLLGSNVKTISPYTSALTRFVDFFKKDPTDTIGSEFLKDFDTSITLFVQKHYGGVKSSSKSTVSALRSWRRVLHQLIKKDALPASFSGALFQLVQQDGRSVVELAETAGVRYNALSNWINGFCYCSDLESLVRVEGVLGVPAGTLTSRNTVVNWRTKKDLTPEEWYPPEVRGTKGQSLVPDSLM